VQLSRRTGAGWPTIPMNPGALRSGSEGSRSTVGSGWIRGEFPAWRADGKELYWVGLGDNTLMAASVELQAAGVRVGRTEALFHLPAGDGRAFFQPAHDGRRFLVYEPEGAPQYRPMVVIENWAARLGR